MEINEIEHRVACGEMTAAQVFTQMRQHIADSVIAAKWVKVADRLPERINGQFGEMQFFCKNMTGADVCEFIDFDSHGKLEPGYFDDETVTEWLSIPGVTKAV